MVGKGQKRREKNYRAAHGGSSTRLPPPPDHSTMDTLPRKLRDIIAFSAPTSQGSAKAQVGGQNKAESKGSGEKRRADNTIFKPVEENEDEHLKPGNENNSDGDGREGAEQKKKRKRKKTQADDLRFAAELEKLGVRSCRRERKKEFLKAKKKKQKKKNAQDDVDAPRRDIVKFGEIVEAPPKLTTVPKAPKKPMEASQERLRLQAVEAYRSRRKWVSRPGIQLPPPGIGSPGLR